MYWKWTVRIWDCFEPEHFAIMSVVDSWATAQQDAVTYFLSLEDEPENDRIDILAPDGSIWQTLYFDDVKTASC